MRTFKAFNNPEIFITGATEPKIDANQQNLIDFKNDLNDFCRIINFIRQDKRWIAVINPSSLLKRMLNSVELDTRQIIMVYSNDKTKNIDTICRALACGNCAAVIGKLDNISSEDYKRLFDSSIVGNSIAYVIGVLDKQYNGSICELKSSEHLLINQTNELSFDPIELERINDIDLSTKIHNRKNIIDFKLKKEELQSSFEF